MGLSSKQVSVDSRPEWSAHSQGLLFEAGEIAPEKPKPLGRQATLQKLQGGGAGQPPPLKCPRCDSSNTKFCYYNNYSRSQPRHFCKACRRHWTNGGTLRNVPVGGTRKAKRPRTSHLPSSSATAASNDNIDMATATTMQQQEPFSFSDVIRQALLHQPPSSMPAVMPDYLSAGIDGGAGGPGILGSLMHLQPMPSFTNTMGSSAGFVDSAGDAFVPSYSSFLRLTMHEEPIAGEEEKAMPATDSSMISAATAPWMQSSLLTCSLAAGTSPLETAPQNTDAAGHAGGGGYWWDDLTGFVSPPPPPPPPPPQNSHLLL